MENVIKENLSFKDRLTRVTTGTALALSPLLIDESSALIAAVSIAAAYPLMTALTAIDPVIGFIESKGWKFSTGKHTTSTAPV